MEISELLFWAKEGLCDEVNKRVKDVSRYDEKGDYESMKNVEKLITEYNEKINEINRLLKGALSYV